MAPKKILGIVAIFIGVGIIVSFGLIAIISARRPTAGLKVDTSPPSLVFVNDTQIGQTPVDRQFPPGEVSVKLVSSSTDQVYPTYQTTVRLTNRTYSVIRRQFAPTENETAGEAISLQPQSQKSTGLSVNSSPPSATVSVDSEPQGLTPVLVSNISPGDHQIVVSAPGYVTRTISAQALAGHILSVNVKLGVSALAVSPTPVITSAAVSGTPRISLTYKSGLTPTVKKPTGSILTPTPALQTPYITVLDTPTGFLRVRPGPGTNYSQVGSLSPGQSFPLLDSQAGWYHISAELDATSSGWISAEYARKFE